MERRTTDKNNKTKLQKLSPPRLLLVEKHQQQRLQFSLQKMRLRRQFQRVKRPSVSTFDKCDT